MAYDVELADRLRAILSAEEVTEKRMFGGLAFLLGTRLAVSASGSGGLLVRVDPDRMEELLADPRTSRFSMHGREMTGWLRVELDADAPEEELGRWVGIGLGRARSLPAG